MQKRHLLVGSLIALTSTLAMAGTMGLSVPQYSFSTGPYVGLSAGPLINMVGLPAFYTGFSGTGSVGYSRLFHQHLYLSGEIFGSDNGEILNRPNMNNNFSMFLNGNIRSSWSYGVNLIPGIMINDRLLGYVRGGFIRQQFNKVIQQSNKTGISRNGWNVGIGGQSQLYRNIDLRLEYVLSRYQRIGGYFPATNQVNLGFVYKFV